MDNARAIIHVMNGDAATVDFSSGIELLRSIQSGASRLIIDGQHGECLNVQITEVSRVEFVLNL